MSTCLRPPRHRALTSRAADLFGRPADQQISRPVDQQTWHHRHQVIQNSVLCLWFPHQKTLKQNGMLAFFWFPSSFLLPLRCLKIIENLSNIRPTFIRKYEKWRPGVVLGALGRALGGIWTQDGPKLKKNKKTWLGEPHPPGSQTGSQNWTKK